MRESETMGEFIWLRQSATFSVNGQSRTLEVAIPVRPGASSAEIEQMLAQADSGMARLTERLDARIAAALGAPLPEASRPTASPPAIAPAIEAPTPSALTTPAPIEDAEPEPAVTPPANRPPARPATPPADPIPSAPARPSAPPAASPAVSPAANLPDLTRQEFIASAASIGLNPKEAMTRLGVNSLSGLNLREALESLRRQLLRDENARPAASEPPPSPTRSQPATSQPATSQPAAARYFEEEEPADNITFAIADDEDYDNLAPSPPLPFKAPARDAASSEPADGLYDDFEMDDVPDFGPPPAAHQAPRPAASSRPTPRAVGAAPATPVSRAHELIARMRAALPGGIPSAQRMDAYKNIVIGELSEADASLLVRGLWNLPIGKIGPEQLEELISWGKDVTFAEDAAQVLATLRAEQQAKSDPAAPKAPSGPAARPRPSTGAPARTPGAR